MAFAFSPTSGANAPSINAGAELAEIDPEALGFSALGLGGTEGAKKLKLLPNPWPHDKLPPSSASLLSIASKRGLLAAGGPDGLVLASTEKVRRAFKEDAGEQDIISNFAPDVTIPLPPLRQVAFSSNEDFLLVSAESGGGLAIYNSESLLKPNPKPEREIGTEKQAVKALLPNPSTDFEQYYAVILDSGRIDVVDVTQDNQVVTLQKEGVVCAAWSVKGKAIVAGLSNGTAVQYMASGRKMATVPRPPEVPNDYIMSAVHWLNNDEFFVVHSSKKNEEEDNIYNFVKTNKDRSSFSFSRAPCEVLFSNLTAPPRNPPPRFSVFRLRNWEPVLDDMLIVAASNSSDTAVFTVSSEQITAQQETINDWVVTNPIDSRKAQLPQMVLGEEGDSLLVGEALDLSSREKVLRPVPLMPEIMDSGSPLPAYFMLTHQGILSAWWIVWNQSIEASKPYPGLINPTCDDQEASTENKSASPAEQSAPSASTAAPVPAQTSPVKPVNPFSTPAVSKFAEPSFGSPSTPAFGKPATPAFGKPATPAFGTTSMGGSTTPAFGAPSTTGGSSTPAFGAPSMGGASKPAFGAPSAMGGASKPAFGAPSAFGSSGGMGNKTSPWGSASQSPAAQPKANPFASAAADSGSGFAKFGSSNGATPFSSFGSVSGGQSSFASLGQQKSPFGGAAGGFKGLTTEPSFGSTVTVSSKEGSTLPSWGNTPAQKGGSVFGQAGSSFTSTKSSDTVDADEAQRRQRDEATPTPQSQGLFGVPSNGFKLGSTFKGDGTAKDDLPKPAAPSSASLFGGDFASTLGGSSSKPTVPATPIKEEGQEKRLQDISTTPASPPKPAKPLFGAPTPAKETATPKAPVPAPAKIPEDAPLPPDPMTWKTPKKDEDDLPPLAGSPPVEVHAPKSNEPSSEEESENDEQSEDEGDEDEEDEEDDEGEDFEVEEQADENEPSPSDAARRSRSTKPAWSLQNSVNQGPRFPAAPTPPVVKSGPPSRSGRSESPAPPLFGQANKPAVPSPFSQPPKIKAPAWGANARTQSNLRSPSPVRSASTSMLGSRREPVIPPGASSLSASIQQSKPPTPQLGVSDLEDDEDERVRELLASDVEPSRTLDRFVAHTDYNGASKTKTGHAAQIEIVYRDINSMVDTVGLNWRSLKAFVEFHERPQTYTERTRAALEEVEEQGEMGPWFDTWSLVEIKDLMDLEDQLEGELDAGRVQDVVDKLSQMARLFREKARLMTKINDIRRQIINRKDPEKLEAIRKASLPKELADQQKALRNDYAAILTQLAKAEEALMLCRSKLASAHARNGKTESVPTVEAVKNTINKLISLTEKKNSEIALLESRFRRLNPSEPSRPSSSSSRQVGTPSRRSRTLAAAESPFVTPATSRSKMSLAELNRRALTPEVDTTPSKGYGLFYTPPGSPSDPVNELLQIESAVEDNLEELKQTSRKRRGVAKGLSIALLERGVKTTKVG
ncbi:hypothetical protein BS50DRAFT_624594 [Corynespora cassiicola Philippines]|uniref:Nucleoporin Nup159/Nup146 N-terminal domain-containing protein n=1 Tax=Corynespora cassiicola Philippines TaxID=1448308 RepID=A0A2T2NBL0_CORCC|nr:hypothetical protein BS50DRAFT_624594 [Corynespora cassiicola Philippines]